MRVTIASDYDEMSRRAARIIADEVRKNPALVLGLATGSTPLGTYRELIRMHAHEGLDLSRVITYNLDEYVGLPATDRNSYNFFMRENFFAHVNIDLKNIHIPQGDTDNPEEFCRWYEERIMRVGGIDLQLLGIGRDGHIAFNEPGSSFESRMRVVSLHRETIEDNARFFDKEDDVPRRAITMGIGTIFEARKIVLIASGSAKAGICAQCIEAAPTTAIPATALQRHSDTVVILDWEAASKLTKEAQL